MVNWLAIVAACPIWPFTQFGAFFYDEGRNKLAKFYAVQMFIVGLIIVIMHFLLLPFTIFGLLLFSYVGSYIISGIDMILTILRLVFLLASFFLMYNAFLGEKYKLPIIGEISEDYSK